MSISRQPDHISENSSAISFTLRFPPGASKPTFEVINFDSSKSIEEIKKSGEIKSDDDEGESQSKITEITDDKIANEITNCYIKLVYTPNIFETVLPFKINVGKTKVKIDVDKNELILVCPKTATFDKVATLKYSKPTKSTIKQSRDQALETQRSENKLLLKTQKCKKDVNKKLATSAAMTMDGSNKKNLTKIKENEILSAFKNSNGDKEAERDLKAENDLDADDDDKNYQTIHEKADSAVDRAIAAKQKQKLLLKKNKDHEAKQKLIPIRNTQNSTLEVKLSHRVFPTAARQKYLAEETEWLAKQSTFRKKIEIDNPDLMEHEKDPAWLKDKGNKLYKASDFISATHAYSLALKITPNDPNLYLNRSASYLNSNMLHKCVSDCQTAIEILTPAVADNLKQRAKAFSRRGAAFTKLGMFDRAVDDIKHAYSLVRDENIKRDLLKIEELMEKESC